MNKPISSLHVLTFSLILSLYLTIKNKRHVEPDPEEDADKEQQETTDRYTE